MGIDKINKILVMNLGGIGDLLLSVPFLRGLRESYPDSFITLWAVNRAKDIVQGLKYFDELILFDIQELRLSDILIHPGRLWNASALLHTLRKKEYSLTINLLPIVDFLSGLKMALVFFLIGSPVRAGRDTEGRGFFYGTRVFERDMPEVYDVEIQSKLLEALGGRETEKGLEIYISEEEKRIGEKLLSECGFSEKGVLIGVNPGSDWPSKRWEIENYASVIKGLSKKGPVNVIITGGKNEEGIAKELAGLLEYKPCVLAGRTSLKALASIIKKMDLFITNDTGPMHISIAMGTPLVAIVGPGYYKRFIPERLNIIMVRKGVDCSPCTKRECSSMKCLREISPDEVVQAAERLLKR